MFRDRRPSLDRALSIGLASAIAVLAALSRARLALSLVLLCALASPVASTALAQGGYTTEKHPELGLTFPRARDYEQIPTPPDEQFIVLHFGEKIPEKPKPKKLVRPEMLVVWIDFVPDAPPDSPMAGVPASETSGDAAPSAVVASEKPKPVINSLERWFEREKPGWKLGVPVEGKERDGYSAREYTLVNESDADARPAGWAYAWKNACRTVAVIGFCAEDELLDQVKIWRASAEHLKISEPEELSTDNLKRRYARLTFFNPEFRIGVRKKLVRGWSADDTEHFIVIYDTPDQALMRKIERDIELLWTEYTRLFPPAGEMKVVSTVRVCKNRDEYFAYGGPPHTAGYWNKDTEELVLYDAEPIDKQRQRSDSSTLIALYHEAFHQFIHYSAGELPPHPWFNEGHGDYFSGASVGDGKVRGIGVNPWRVSLIKYALMTQQFVHWKDIVRYELAQYYANRDICYAQGWSMIYFLRTSKDVAKRPEWASILPSYFEALKKAWAEELQSIDAQGQKNDKVARARAGLLARQRAVDQAFAGVDIDEIERAWSSFVEKLEPGERKPEPGERKSDGGDRK